MIARIVLLALVATCLCSPSEQAVAAGPDAPPRPVMVTLVSYASRTSDRTLVGTIRPRVETDLGFRVAGKVAQRFVGVGDVVRSGDRLAALDEVDLRLQTEQADAELRAATAAVKQADADLVRSVSLTGKGYAAGASLDRQEAATEEAHGRKLRAERGLTLARNAQSYAVLTADADGVVTATNIEPGQVVAVGQPAIRLAHSGEKEAVVSLPESLVSLATGTASVALWSRPERRYKARLREFSPAADSATRTYLARYAMPDADTAVQIGMTATVTVSMADERRVARVPLSALFNQGAGPSVWTVVADGHLVLKPVETAGYDGRDVLIAGGLADGDRVVTLGVSKLDPGQIVRVVDTLQF